MWQQGRKKVIIGGRAHNVREAEAVAMAGFPFVEISVTDDRVFFDEQLSQLKRIKDEFGIFYLAHGPEEGNSWDPCVLRRDLQPLIQSLLDCSKKLAISLFTIHFWIDCRFISNSAVKEKIKILREMSSYASSLGIQLCIENLSERFSDFLPAFEAADNLGMTLDVGHGELLSRQNTSCDFSRCCIERINHIHLHDNRGGNSPSDDLHLPIGQGNIDFCSILGGLKKQGFDKTITLEVRPEDMLNCKAVVESIWNKRE